MKTIQYFANGNLGKKKQTEELQLHIYQHTYQWPGIMLQKLEAVHKILYNDLGCSILSVCACLCVCAHAHACVCEWKKERKEIVMQLVY